MKTTFVGVLVSVCLGAGCLPSDWFARPAPPVPPREKAPSEAKDIRSRPPVPVTREQVTPSNGRDIARALEEELSRDDDKPTPRLAEGRKP
jgi:hypothetical protein